MKKVVLIVLGVVLLTAAGLGVYIATIDWNKHKDKIAMQFSDVTGKEIVFDGPVSFEILPSPYLTASNVKIFNPGGLKGRPLVEIKRLVASLALGPLLKGDLNIKRMVLESPQINVELTEDLSVNWQYPLTAEQRNKLENTEITLNSVSVEKATLNFEDAYHNIDLKLDNLNGEIIAQNIMGPYRIEGNYIKDNNPEGFAISVGQLSNSLATSLNLVFTHPVSQSYVRFDGSFQLNNKVLNGNMIVESDNLMKFAKINFGIENFKPEYNYASALTFDINANPTTVNISSIVAKYGETQGAGNVKITMNDGWGEKSQGAIRPRMDMAFNFTDLDLTPVVFTVKDFIDKYREKGRVYHPDLGFDMLADVKSMRTIYNGQPIKDFEASFDYIDGQLTLNKLAAVLPGDTTIKASGDLSAYQEQPFYNIEASFNSNDFLKTLNWLNITPAVSTAATYRKAVGSAKLSGNFNRIHVSPFALTMDKSTLSGEAGIKLEERLDAMVILNADMINFDNYISALPAEEQEKNWAQRMKYRFARLGFLNDFDMQLEARIDLAIYENMPFEKVDMKGTLLNGTLDLDHLAINSVANAKMDFAGKIKGFGQVPAYENLQYQVNTEDVASLINKFEFQAPDLDYKQMKNFTSKGVASGDLEKFAVNSVTKLENLEFTYAGQVDKDKDGFSYNGNLEVRHPDFVKMLNDFNLNYNPQTYSLGLFELKTKFSGKPAQFRANPLEFNIGFNNFQGDLSYEAEGSRPNILANMSANKFEIDRFLNKPKSPENIPLQPGREVIDSEGAEFLRRPVWEKTAFDYDFYKKFDLSGTFNVQNLSYQNQELKNAVVIVALANGSATFSSIKGEYKGGQLEAETSLNMLDNPAINASAKLENADFGAFKFGGKVYGLNRGSFSGKATMNSSAASAEEMIANLDGTLEFVIDNVMVRGWNLPNIYNDIIKRNTADGLLAFVKENLHSGSSDISRLKGKLAFNKGGFSFTDTSMSGNGVDVSVFGDGNLGSWDMNVLFNVKYDEPKYLPGYSFSLKGTMDAPLLDVDVSALHELFRSRQEKVEAQEKAVIEAELKRRQGQTDEQRLTAEKLLGDLRDNVLADLNEKAKVVYNQDTESKYRNIRNRLDRETAVLAQTINQAKNPQIDDALIKQLRDANQKSTANAELLKRDLKSAYIADLKFQMKVDYNKVVDSFNNYKMIMFNFNTLNDTLLERLEAIKTDFKLDDEKEIAELRTYIAEKSEAMEAQDQELLDRFTQMQEVDSAEGIEAYNAELKDLQEQAALDLKDIQESVEKYKANAEKRVKLEEDNYANRIREAEVKRKLEENVGRISVKKTGRSVTIRRDIEDIEKSEELTSQEKIPVLDFSTEKFNVELKKAIDTKSPQEGIVIRK